MSLRDRLERLPLERRLERLLHKYRTLQALRARRDRVEATGGAGFEPDERAARGRAFRALAAEFPGALRELEVLPTEVLAERADAVAAELAAAVADPARVRPGRLWVAVVLDFHDLLRELLALRLALARGEPAAADAATIDRVRHPPGGRVVALVWQDLSARHGLTTDELRGLVFRPPRG